MRLYLLRHPGGLLLVGVIALADTAYRLFLREPLRNTVLKGRPR